MTPGTVEVTLPRLERLTFRALRALGLSSSQVAIVADVLLYAQIRDSTQGLIKLVERTVAPVPGAQPLTIEQLRPAMARIRANGELGMVVLRSASDLLTELACQHGLATVTTVGTSTSSGALGYYAQRIAESGLIALITAGSPKALALHGGLRPVLGSNALAIAIPRKLHVPIILDMTTAAAPVFQLHAAKRRGAAIDDGLAIDSNGQPTTDPTEALAGALLPFAGAKGSGLALMLECLSGPLAGGSIVGEEADSRGNFLLAIDPQVFDADGRFDATVTTMLKRMDFVAPEFAASGVGPRLPGARSSAIARAVAERGRIAIESWLLTHLRALALTTRNGTA